MCLAPRAVKTSPDDLKVSREDGDVHGSSSGKPGSSVINDAADVDGTRCTLDAGAVECTTEETDVGEIDGGGGDGGDGGDASGGGGSGSGGGDPSGSDGGGGSEPSAPPPASEFLAFAGWAASATERATRADVAAGLSGSARVAAASLFGLNLATASLVRAATRDEKETTAPFRASPAAVPAPPAAAKPASDVASDASPRAPRDAASGTRTSDETETETETDENARLDAAALRWERAAARRRAAADLAEASVDESVDAVVRTVGAALARGSPAKRPALESKGAA